MKVDMRLFYAFGNLRTQLFNILFGTLSHALATCCSRHSLSDDSAVQAICHVASLFSCGYLILVRNTLLLLY